MSEYVTTDPDVMSGAPVFAGTRVLVRSLFDYIEGGDSIEDFLQDFPTVTRVQVTGLLEELRKQTIPETEAA